MNTLGTSTLACQQQALLQALQARSAGASAASDGARLADFLDMRHTQAIRGLAVYRANGHAMATRALRSAYPVVASLIGAHSFTLLARDLWHQHPPQRGDLAQWGDALPSFLQRNTQLADVPYLSDVACAEWALHRAHGAVDAAPDPTSFARLAQEAPEGLTLTLAPGTTVIDSRYPVATLIEAHLGTHVRLDEAAQRLRDGEGEHALVWRQGLRPRLQRIDPSVAALVRLLLSGADLTQAVAAAGAASHQAEDFDVSAWLHTAVADALVVGVAPRVALRASYPVRGPIGPMN